VVRQAALEHLESIIVYPPGVPKPQSLDQKEEEEEEEEESRFADAPSNEKEKA